MIISHTFSFSNSLFLTNSPELYSAYISFSLSIPSNILITLAIISLAYSLLNNALNIASFNRLISFLFIISPSNKALQIEIYHIF